MLALLLSLLLTVSEDTSSDLGKPIEKVESVVIDPLRSKELAKAKLEAATVSTRELQLAKLDAARLEYEARERESISGRGTLDILLGASLRLLESEGSVWDSSAEQLTALHRYWERSKMLEERMKALLEAGRIPTKEYYEVKYRRLMGEIWIAEAKARGIQPALQGWRNPLALRPLDARQLAQAKVSSSRSSVKEINEAKLEAAQFVYFSRSREFLAGRSTLDILLGCSLRLLEAEQALAKTETERIAALERHWARCRLIERVNLARYRADRIAIQDYLQSRYFLLEAELWLTQLKRKKDLPVDFVTGVRVPFKADWPPDLDPQDLAKAAFDALHTDTDELTRKKLEAARGGAEARFREFLAGRGTLDILLEVSLHRLESDVGLAATQPERLAAHEKHWERMVEIEIIQRDRYSRARIPIQDYMESKYFRLEAQIWLTQAMAKRAVP
jgi:hypothetical protein